MGLRPCHLSSPRVEVKKDSQHVPEAEYVKGLKDHPREVWIDGERLKDVTIHSALRNGVTSVASLYDMQYDPVLREEMTFASPSTGDQVGLSYRIPQTVEDLERRRSVMTRWAWATCGMMGRSPDFLNTIFSSWAGASGYFAQDRFRVPANVQDYHEFLQENYVPLTHALVNLQRRRRSNPTDTLSEGVALTLVKETRRRDCGQGQSGACDSGPNLRLDCHIPGSVPSAG